MKQKKKEDTIFYQCMICHFVLKQERTERPPSYCPNCVVNQQKGLLKPIGEDDD